MKKDYSDQEVRLILQRALEPIPGEEGKELGSPGLSLEAIKEIAAEVGIDPNRVDLAASDLHSPIPASANPFVGIPTTVHFQSTIDGREMGDIPQSEVVSVIRGALGRHGIVETRSGSFEWKARDAMGGRYVSISPSKDGVRISVLGNYRDGVFTLMMGAGGVIFVGIAAILSGLGFGSAGILIGAAAVAAIPPRFFYRWWRKREDGVMATLHGKLLELFRSSDQPG